MLWFSLGGTFVLWTQAKLLDISQMQVKILQAMLQRTMMPYFCYGSQLNPKCKIGFLHGLSVYRQFYLRVLLVLQILPSDPKFLHNCYFLMTFPTVEIVRWKCIEKQLWLFIIVFLSYSFPINMIHNLIFRPTGAFLKIRALMETFSLGIYICIAFLDLHQLHFQIFGQLLDGC